MLPLKGKTGLCSVIKIARVKRPDIGLGALMLLVAGLAISGDFAVNTSPGGNSFGHRLMAGQAAAGLDLLAVGVALDAIRLARQRAVRLRERTGSGELGLRTLSREGEKGDHKQTPAGRQKREPRLR
jgi:hypothetical protein